MRDVIAKFLKPNGIAYVSYNAMPGQAALSPLRDAFKRFTEGLQGSITSRATMGLKYLKYLQHNDARYIKDNPLVSATIDDLHRRDLNYVAHESLTDHYTALDVKTVAAGMAEKSLKFCCGIPQGPAWKRRDQLRKFETLLKSRSGPLAREAETSVLLNEGFRADIYCRANHDIVDGTSGETFMSSLFGATNLLPPVAPPSRQLKEKASAIQDAFASGLADFKTVHDQPGLQELAPDLLAKYVHFLVEDRHLRPLSRPPYFWRRTQKLVSLSQAPSIATSCRNISSARAFVIWRPPLPETVWPLI